MYDRLPMGLFVNNQRVSFTNIPLVCAAGPQAGPWAESTTASWEEKWEAFLKYYRGNTRYYPPSPSVSSNTNSTLIPQQSASLPVDTSIVSLGKRIGIADCYTLYNVMLPDMLVGWLVFRHKITGSNWSWSEQQREMYDITDNKVHGPKGPLIPINIVK